VKPIHVIVQALAPQGDVVALFHALFFDMNCWPSHRVSTTLRQQPVSLW